MGRFSVEFDVSNLDDVRDAARGVLPPERVQSVAGILASAEQSNSAIADTKQVS